jgi:hypothetical protein
MSETLACTDEYARRQNAEEHNRVTQVVCEDDR